MSEPDATLSRPVPGVCVCCGFATGGTAPGRNARWQALAREGVCGQCYGHYADTKAMRALRERDHRERLHKELAARTEGIRSEERRRFEAERRTSERRIGELEEELARRPVVEISLDKEVVACALADCDEAYRKRDVALSALSELRVMHHEQAKQPGQCTCGERRAKCAIAKLVDIEYVKRWEEKQAERMSQGFGHMLPPNHPRMLDRRVGNDEGRPESIDEAFGIWGPRDDNDRARRHAS
jgi:hypothetical protein